MEDDSARSLPCCVVADDADLERLNESQHALVIGDNLHGLRAFLPALRDSVQLAYIDPPYNTGKAFTFNDRFARTEQRSSRASWLGMLLPRLEVLRDTLRQSGLLCVSIGAQEVHYLRCVLDSVFGESNFLGEIAWKKRTSPPNDKLIGDVLEYILVYAKSAPDASVFLIPRDDRQLARYQNRDDDPRGAWVPGDLSANGKGGRLASSLVYSVINPQTGQEHHPPQGTCWRFSKVRMAELMADDRIYFGKSGTAKPKLKRFLTDVRPGVTISTIWDDCGTNADARREIKDIFSDPSTFETPKPLTLMRRIIEMGSEPGDLVLDAFAGSGTTGHACVELGRRSISFESGERPINGRGPDRIAEITLQRLEYALERVQLRSGVDVFESDPSLLVAK